MTSSSDPRDAASTPAWRDRLLPFVEAANAGNEEARRQLVVALASLLGTPMLAYYAVASFLNEQPVIAALCAGASVMLLATFMRVRVGGERGTARAALVCVIALLGASLIFAEGHFSLAWVVAMPLLLTFIFGRLEAACWSAVLLVGFLTVLLAPTWFGVPADAPYWPWRGAIEDFAFAFAMVTFFSIAFETLRRNALARLEAALADRAASEDRASDFNRIGTDLLFELDPELRVTHLSGAWAELTGIPTESVVGLTFAQEADGYTRSGWEGVAARLEARETVRDEPVVFHLEDGRDLTIMVRAVPLFAEDGSFLGYRGVGVDQTARSDAEHALREKDRALEHATRMEVVGQLTSGVAHDFNNLLTVIMGNLELVDMQLEEAGLDREELEQVAMAARRAADLTSKLLAFSRRQALRPGRIDVGELLLETQQLLGRTLPEHIRVLMKVQGETPDCRADRSQLESALLNLALNARDAMPEGGTLLLEATGVSLDEDQAAAFEVGAGDYVLIRVVDTGSGMAPELVEHVFEPFFTTKPTGKGTGLGLSMVYGFVRQSGGGVRVRSTPGSGTTLELLLPPADDAEADATEAGSAVRHRGEGRRALVVEDEAGVRSLVTTMLGRLGYDVRAVPTGDAALQALEDATPDLVVSDVVLAGTMNGVAVVAAIRNRAPHTPAVLMSGYSETHVRAGRNLPLDVPLLAKPFGLAELEATLNAAFAPGEADQPEAG